jgi:outer membrane protein
MKVSLAAIGLIALVSLGGVIWLLTAKKEKIGFVYNQQVFEKFEGTRELKEKLSRQEAQFKSVLDSLSLLVNSGRKDLVPYLQNKAQELGLKHQEVSQTYTADIWKRINDEAMNFGKENGYDYILGAAGNGNMMYAKDQLNVTDEFIEYLNTRYTGKK